MRCTPRCPVNTLSSPPGQLKTANPFVGYLYGETRALNFEITDPLYRVMVLKSGRRAVCDIGNRHVSFEVTELSLLSVGG